MSRKRKTSHTRNHELENERSTRKSARLNNPHSINHSKSKILERKKITKLQRNILKTCPVFTRSRGRLISCDMYNCSKPHESTGTDENTTENNSDSDRSIVKTLTYSSSDSNDCKSNMFKSSKVLSHSYDQSQLHNRKNVDDGQTYEKARTETSHKASLRSVTNQPSYNLRRRSPRAAESGNETSTSATLRCVTNQNGQSSRKCPRIAESDGETPNNALLRNVTNPKSNRRRSPRFVESGSEIPNIGEEKIIAKKAQKTKVKEAKNESNRKPFVVDPHKPKVQALKQYACMPSSIIEDQEKDVKKAKVKKRGPLARKRELRAMLERQDEGYEDDAFDGTPFKNRKPLLKCKLSPVVLDTSMQSISRDTEFYKTPCSKTPVNRLRPAGPLSSGTSESDIMTPGLLNSVNRNHIDCYVNQLKRRKIRLGCSKKIKSHTPLSKKSCRIVQSKSFDFASILEKSTAESENCENADYYWSDIE